MEVTIFQAGYCTHIERVIKKDGQWKSIKFPALFALIKHPNLGYILFDTGYSTEFYKLTKKFPYNIYGKITPVYVDDWDSSLSQLQQYGVEAKDIKYIIISHFHADHIGGVKLFPYSTFIYSKEEYHYLKNKRGLAAVKNGFIPELLPYDFEERSMYIEDFETIDNPVKDSIFKKGYDLFGDGKIAAIHLSGHTKGQYGIYLTDKDKQPYFFIADSCWIEEAYEELKLPSKVSHLIMDNPNNYVDTLNKISYLHKKYPEIKIIPSHSNRIKTK